MNSSIYEKLKDNFVMIRYLHCDMFSDEESVNNAKNNIVMIRSAIVKEGNYNLPVYCIDSLLEIIQENNREKTFDFADLVHNMPEICSGKRNIKSFKREIRIFNRKYKTKYFNEYIRLFSPKAV